MEVRYTKSALKVLRRIQPKKAVSILDKMDEIAQDPFKADNLITALGACPRIEIVTRRSWFESDFSLI